MIDSATMLKWEISGYLFSIILPVTFLALQTDLLKKVADNENETRPPYNWTPAQYLVRTAILLATMLFFILNDDLPDLNTSIVLFAISCSAALFPVIIDKVQLRRPKSNADHLLKYSKSFITDISTDNLVKRLQLHNVHAVIINLFFAALFGLS